MSTTMQTFRSRVDAPSDFEDFPIDGVVAGELKGRVHWLRQEGVGEGMLLTGIFTGEPSTFPYQYAGDETFHVIEGSVTIQMENGESVDLKPGDIASFPKGAKSTWVIHEPFRKFFVISG